MPIWLWITLIASALPLTVTGSIAGIRAARAWNDAHTVGAALAVTLADVAGRASAVETRATRLREHAERIESARGALESDLDTLRVIAAELQALQEQVVPILAFVPTK